MSAPSAKGLFRAMGKDRKATAVQLLDGTFVKTAGGLAREKDDFYPTPPEPTRAFLHAEIDRLRDFDAIWEPAVGDGAMAREMEACGLTVHCSDIIDRGNRFGATMEIGSFYDAMTARAPAILTNPPFSECSWGNGKARWLKHALDVLDVDYLALLMNWSWPGAGGACALLGRTPALTRLPHALEDRLHRPGPAANAQRLVRLGPRPQGRDGVAHARSRRRPAGQPAISSRGRSGMSGQLNPRRNVLPQRRYAESFDLAFPAYSDKLYTVTLGCHPDGRLAEVFISSHRKIGADADLAARDTAILISLALQHGATVEGLAHAMTHNAQAQPEGLAGRVLAELMDWQARNSVERL